MKAIRKSGKQERRKKVGQLRNARFARWADHPLVGAALLRCEL